MVYQKAPLGTRSAGQGPGRSGIQTGLHGTGAPGPVCGEGERPGRAGNSGRDIRAEAMALVVAAEGGGDPDHPDVLRRPGDLYRREAQQRLLDQSHGGPHGEGGGAETKDAEGPGQPAAQFDFHHRRRRRQ